VNESQKRGLEIINLTKVYNNEVVAVDKLDLSVSPGEIFAMLGANGAGKTTTLMCCLGFTDPTEGTVKINEIDVVRDPLAAKRYVAYVSENVRLYPNFTARQNLDFFTKLAGKKHVSRDEYDTVLGRVGLDKSAFHRRVKGFSKGMRQRLGIAIAIMKEAEVILLDEPTSGLDPKGGKEFLALLGELRGENRAILMTTHDIFRARQIADRVGIMNAGRMMRIITREEAERESLEDLYLKYVDIPIERRSDSELADTHSQK
jgi:ABC-2 type transport system ATP-binding protein